MASTMTLPSCTRRARAWLAVRPTRSTSTSATAGPTSGDETYETFAATTWGWVPPAAATAARPARPSVASR